MSDPDDLRRGKHIPDLWTTVQRLDYDFETGTGRLYMPAWCCTDMCGAIRLFSRIDPDVQTIRTYAGAAPDTAYLRRNGEWIAIGPSPEAA